MEVNILEGLKRGYRLLKLKPETINKDNRTIEVSLGTGARGKRFGWFNDYFEELEVSIEAVDLSRLKSGAPFLDAHDARSNDSVLGVFEDAWIREGHLEGRVRFDETEIAERRFGSISRGILVNTSVGYDVRKYIELDEREDDLPIYRAVDWTPMEGSIVPIGFDNTAKIRSFEGSPESPCEIVRVKNINDAMETSEMSKRNKGENKAPEAETKEVVEDVKVEKKVEQVEEPTRDAEKELEIRDQERKLERERIKNITSACERMGMSDLAETLVDEGLSYEQATVRLVEAKKEKEPKMSGRNKIQVGAEEQEKRNLAIENSILFKVNRSRYSEGIKGNDYREASIVDMVRHKLGSEFAFAHRNKVIRAGLHTTSDFPTLLSNVANKVLRDEYAYQGQTFSPFVDDSVQVPDFKNQERDRLGDAEKFDKVNEHGEYKHTTMAENKETYKVHKYGKKFGITFEALVNDDLSAFTRTSIKIARAASRVQGDLVYTDILAANPAMGDGVALFHASHGNLGSAAALSETSLNAGFVSFMSQQGETGDYLGVPPAFLIVSPKQKATAQRLMKEITATKSTDVNPFAGELQIVVESRLLTVGAVAGNGWFLAARPQDIDTIEVATLEGEGGLVITEIQDQDIDGLVWKARLVTGAKAIDWKGLYYNAGA